MRKRLFHGLVLLVLLLAGFGWVSLDKNITVEVDGQARTVRTFARTVGGVLHHARLRVGPHDLLAPANPVRVKSGARIVLRRGRQLSLLLNGRSRTVWVTALSVEEALAQLSIRADGAYLSASRSGRIPLDGMAVEVRQPARVRVLDGGRASEVTTTAASVSQLFAEIPLRLSATDRVSVPLDRYPAHGSTISITRIRDGKQVETQSVAYAVERRPDKTMWVDTTRVLVYGMAGVRVLTYAVTHTNGKLTSKRLVGNQVTVRPRTKVVLYGTKKRTVDSLNWWALAQCESGNNPRAVSRSGEYRGLYQFRLSTWRSVGGVGDPIDASREEQTLRAKRLYLRSGWRPWPVCGRRLFT